MAIGLRRRPPSAPVVAVTPRQQPREVRIRPRSLRVDDVGVLAAALVSSFFLVWLLYGQLTLQAGTVGFAVWWFAAFLVMYWLVVRRMEGALVARDRLMAAVIASVAGAMGVPLLLIVGYVVYRGWSLINFQFLVQDVNVCGPLDAHCGGVGHAIVGTLEQVGIAVLISVPLAVLCAVFLNEIGGPLRRPVRLFVDAMSGVPSVVAGLFIFAVWVVPAGLNRGFSGIGGSLALAILMLPTITRTSEEVLRLVPDGLREGALALGASEWRTVYGVVLPTARSGLITAVILGVARSVGETAPLIFTSLGASVFNTNPVQGPQESLPLFIYTNIQNNPGSPSYQRAWGAALVLITTVLMLFTLARVIGARTSIESRQRRATRRAARIGRPGGAGSLPGTASTT